MYKRFENFNIVGHFKLFGIISIILVAVGVAGIVLLPFGVTLFNLDIDFTGGTTITYEFDTALTRADHADIEKLVSGVSGSHVSVQKSGSDNGIIIKTGDIDSATRDAVYQAISEQYPEAERLGTDNISPVVGNELKNSAIISTVLASVLILIYITIRFEFRSGIAAVIALLHDLLVMVSAYIIFRIPLNMNFIAALLTILGYSINATIIVFDRVRENRRAMEKNYSFADIVDKSIKQTMARNVNTTLTTLLPIVMLIIVGVTSIRNFAIPLTVGILAGAYSSIFISGSIWTKLRKTRKV